MSTMIELLVAIVIAAGLFLALVYATRHQGPASSTDSYRPDTQARPMSATAPGRGTGGTRGRNRKGSRAR
ncbi:hypothetical protein [Streptacidiphilus sp. EB103A]|uniref:hypothetical protein n=1 Tax=Streptacidiphilus sp. EB103A TaxID=3156275 RepID=UPI00351215E8